MSRLGWTLPEGWLSFVGSWCGLNLPDTLSAFLKSLIGASKIILLKKKLIGKLMNVTVSY